MNVIKTLMVRPIGDPQDPTWVFDDAEFGLVAEPFVAGAEKAITSMAKKAGKKITDPLTLLFSDQWFPNFLCSFEKQDTNPPSGADYVCVETGEKAWLCACLFKYYPMAPQKIYAAVK